MPVLAQLLAKTNDSWFLQISSSLRQSLMGAATGTQTFKQGSATSRMSQDHIAVAYGTS
jgi:hypothetical protein